MTSELFPPSAADADIVPVRHVPRMLQDVLRVCRAGEARHRNRVPVLRQSGPERPGADGYALLHPGHPGTRVFQGPAGPAARRLFGDLVILVIGSWTYVTLTISFRAFRRLFFFGSDSK